jgi:hypothetical protein
MLMPARALMTTKKSSSPGSHVKQGFESCRPLCGIRFRFVETPPCLDGRSLLRNAAFGSKRIGSHPIGPEGASNGGTSANLRSGLGAIQTFRPDDRQQRRLRMADLFKNASGYFARLNAFCLATRQFDYA